METTALGVATVAMAVLVVVIAYFDMKFLRIPNWAVMAIIAIYVVTGLWGLPFATFVWHLLFGVIVLFVGFGLYMISMGHIGGGDIKMMAALTPFILTWADLAFVLLTYALVSVVGLFVFKIIRRFLPAGPTGWEAFDQKRFYPAGLLLGITIMLFLIARFAQRMMM